MPIYRVHIEKYSAQLSRYWVNRYFVNTADLETALQAGTDVLNAERTLHFPSVLFTKVRADDNVPNTDNFLTYVVNATGQRSTGGEQEVPYFVTLRVDLTVVGGGRPSRKYFRGCLTEFDVNFTSLHSGIVGLANTFGTTVAALPICDPDGQDISGGVAYPFPQMRQQKRASKKAVTP